jgi:hypothetical protein
MRSSATGRSPWLIRAPKAKKMLSFNAGLESCLLRSPSQVTIN